MTDPDDPVAAFKQRVAGKTVTFNLEAAPVESADGDPRGVAPETTMRFAFDEDGICCPAWESDPTTPEGARNDD
ncbi:hypothetical protein [Mycolicibacterium monacense]|uniref:Uncharacterized protein n=1 Tax=Mycolicibacterium monacense TaxID=85693 RepID=A0AAD1MYY7_MYCMB|nr:hypothetical protein [Mycolicibacterium monacense]MDA4102045.1 hypothetical protein [Mycolicibacterium monacense DSM 44395]ORB20035.1 hypothetical protein BST34_13820 [Mycolicibacterium monacense DSM 44395]QHP86787.1 hypothetical protein EWR22_16315 [Mycolicibacterium monacense DSM 44395]BBZ60141.1 hypothetical protein MMON_14420 [Mycolicibacterium monacense]